MEYEFSVEGKRCKVSLETKGSAIRAVIDGKRFEADVCRPAPNTISILAGGRSYLAHFATEGRTIHVAVGASRFVLEEPHADAACGATKDKVAAAFERTVKAPMPGQVTKVNVEEGAEVQPGDILVTVEAMKMEHAMRAQVPAVVEKVHVRAGQQVDAFQPLLELRPSPAGHSPDA